MLSETLKAFIIAIAYLGVAPLLGLLLRGAPRLRLACFVLMAFCSCRYMALHLYSVPDWTGTARGYAFTAADFFSWTLFWSLIGRPGFRWRPPGAWLYWVYCLLSFSTIFHTDYPMYGGMEILKMCWMYIYFLAAYNYIRTLPDLWPVAYTLLAIVAVVFVVAIKQRYLGGIFQIYSTFPHQNSLSLYAGLVSCILLGILLNERTSVFQTLLLTAGFGMAGLLVYFTLSRGGLAAMAIGIFVTSTLSLLLNGLSAKRVALLLGIGMVGLVLAGMALPRILERFHNAPESSSATRVNLARAACRIANDHKGGVGLNCFSVYSGSQYSYNREQYEQGLAVASEGDVGGIVETVYLLVAAECGWATLAVLLLWLLTYWRYALSAVCAWRHRDCFGLAVGLLGGLTANYLQSGMEWVLKQYNNFYFLMLVFAIVALLQFERVQEKKRKKAAAR